MITFPLPRRYVQFYLSDGSKFPYKLSELPDGAKRAYIIFLNDSTNIVIGGGIPLPALVNLGVDDQVLAPVTEIIQQMLDDFQSKTSKKMQ